ncbi:angiotensin-converting enzyme [Holotrichia oblita]|uniref:Angiotensin-converting enzyme n=1 Tax=Holotrichia oblita TaxID=644536 RepID=A0ACB9TPN7_HOLOL|nr:angiotensin-converting enzyme [Holotrichia oblita]
MPFQYWIVTPLFMLFLNPGRAFAVSDARIVQGPNKNLGEALTFLREYDTGASNICFKVSSAQWNYATNMTDTNKRKMIEQQMLKAKFEKISWKKAALFDWPKISDPMLKRQLKFLITKGRASLPDEKFNEIHHLISEMKDMYLHVKICAFNNYDTNYCDLVLDPDVHRIMEHSRNSDELLHVWREWHDKTGPPMKNKFMRYIQIANQASRMTGFVDAGEQMRYIYEERDFEHEIATTWRALEPLYKELFTYVRRRLYIRYGPDVVRPDGPIPAHILGNIWAQEWSKISDIVIPYPGEKQLDVTDEMLRQGFTPLRMFQMAEEFYTSLGLKPLSPEFWRNSLFEKPNNRKVQCTASAWDFCNKIDYRLKQCTEVTMDDLITVHHEMAHIQYYLQYSEQPYLYRDGANPGFHEGIANAMVLSVYNPVHLHRVGLFNNNTDTYELNMNFLMTMALRKVAYAPFALLVDQNGVRTMNFNWWELRLLYQGIVPPIARNEGHLDAVAKRHIPADLPYMKYYVALLLEFQIFDALCGAMGHTAQLHTCDIYRSREAGRILTDIMQAGKAKHWKDVLRTLRTKTNGLSAEPLLKYFQPLLAWLKVQNRDEAFIGWNAKVEDTALFQPLFSKINGCARNVFNTFPSVVIALIINYL